MDKHSAGDAAKFFADHPELAAGWKGVRPDSARLYKNIAAVRRDLARDPDVPAEVLRDMLHRALVAAEELSEAVNRLQDVCEHLLAHRS